VATISSAHVDAIVVAITATHRPNCCIDRVGPVVVDTVATALGQPMWVDRSASESHGEGLAGTRSPFVTEA
jgi:hypothetical protein